MKNLNQYIEQTFLKPLTTSQDIEKLVAEAKEHNFFGICLPPYWVKKAKRDLEGTDITLVTVVGFPLGYQRTEAKLEEIKLALADGADEIDIVMNLSAFKNGTKEWVKIEFARCAKLIHQSGKLLKVIIETAYLDADEIVECCKMCVDSGVDIVKTSTGLASSGAKLEDVKLMRSVLPENIGIKASGGVRTKEAAIAMIEAGATRLGTSSGITICS